ncbi:hypothetical protein [Pseudoalteromonas tunicata]|nr:hypothetical protein [Pseudoalteromonas tunicata]ATC96701.1 hypothetical protein PTUN_b0286 [Pseudoalteromonas tunicata]AXT32868.1 hypothetical protein D1819_18645 [Pseudoalteromonas tunicata]
MKNDALTELSKSLNIKEMGPESIDVQLVQHIFKLAYDFGHTDGCSGVYVCPSSSFMLLSGYDVVTGKEVTL